MKRFFMILGLLSLVMGQSADSLFQLGNKYYTAEKYQQAANVYEQLSRRVAHEDLYLNLGNSYFRMGQMGNAIWAYEKGNALSPRDSDINYNLKFVRSQIRDRILPPDDFFLVAFYRAIVEKLTVPDLITLGGLIFMLLGFLYVLQLQSFFTEKLASIANGTLLLSIFATGWIMLDKYWDVSDQQKGIVIVTAVDVRSGPVKRGENVVFQIHEGTKAEITTTQTGWYEVILLDGKKGWVPASQMRLL